LFEELVGQSYRYVSPIGEVTAITKALREAWRVEERFERLGWSLLLRSDFSF